MEDMETALAAIHHWSLTCGSSNLQKERSTLEYNRAAGFDKYCILVMRLMRPMYLHVDAGVFGRHASVCLDLSSGYRGKTNKRAKWYKQVALQSVRAAHH